MWGRALGIVFAGPFAYFVLRGYISQRLGLRLSALMTMGAAQGFVGWWMVKSGLEVFSNVFAEFNQMKHLQSIRKIASGICCDKSMKCICRSQRQSIYNQG